MLKRAPVRRPTGHIGIFCKRPLPFPCQKNMTCNMHADARRLIYIMTEFDVYARRPELLYAAVQRQYNDIHVHVADIFLVRFHREICQRSGWILVSMLSNRAPAGTVSRSRDLSIGISRGGRKDHSECHERGPLGGLLGQLISDSISE